MNNNQLHSYFLSSVRSLQYGSIAGWRKASHEQRMTNWLSARVSLKLVISGIFARPATLCG